MKQGIFVYIPLILLLSACGGQKKIVTNRVTLDPLVITASQSEYHATKPLAWDITHTKVALSFNYLEKTANGQAWLDIHPYYYPSDKITLDAKSMKIDKVTIDGNDNPFTYQNDSLIIPIGKTYSKDEKLLLYVKYKAMSYSAVTAGSKAITDEKGLYFINTDYAIPYKPAQVWTQGETEANSHWVPTNDQPNERFTTEIQLTVPDSFKTLSNGKLINQEKQEQGLRRDVWEMDQPIQPYVMMFAIGKYEIIEDENWKNVPINYYVEPEYANYAKSIFEHTPEMIDFFSDVTKVPYPWNKYSQIVVRDYVSGAMENTSASVFGEFVNQTDRELKDNNHENVVAHELFHQWFGDYVTAESWSNITLNESFANYGEQLWRRFKYGVANEQELAFEDFQTYLKAAEKNDDPLARYYYNSKEDVFDRISYQKGGAILHYLHGLMGDSAFTDAMHEYLSGNALSPAEIANWRIAIEKVTGKDWNWFFNQWYMRGGHPVLEFKYKHDDKAQVSTITITQKQDEVYKLPLYTEMVFGNERIEQLLEIENVTTTINIPYRNSTKPVILPDTRHWLPGEIVDNKNATEWVAHFKAAKKEDFISKVLALQSNVENLHKKEIKDLYRLGLNDNLDKIREYALLYLYQSKASGLGTTFSPDVKFLAINDPSNSVRAAAFDLLGKWETKDFDTELYTAVNDQSYQVAAAALGAISVTNKDTAYLLAKNILKTSPGGELKTEIIYIIGKNAEPADTTFIRNYKYRVGGSKKVDFVEAMARYIENTSSNKAFIVGLQAVEDLILTENIAPYRSAMAISLISSAYFYKNEIKSTNTYPTNEKATLRFNQIMNVLDKVKANETNEGNLATYNTYFKELNTNR